MPKEQQKIITPFDVEPGELTRFFLACEISPGTPGFSPIDPFAYDIVPAYIKGTMGIIHYEPDAFSIIDIHPGGDFLLGFQFTVSHPDTVALLDRIKGYYGPDGFNMHIRMRTECWTEPGKLPTPAWVYLLDTPVVNAYETVEQVEFGLWNDKEERLNDLLDSLIDPPSNENEPDILP